jgi:type IV pilus assembly protein PilC
MAVFQWKGIEGNQMNSGEIEAPNEDVAKEKLQAQNIIVTQMVMISGSNEAKGSKKDHPGKGDKKIKNVELMIFTKKFATMVQAGLPIMKTLKMLEEQTENQNFRRIVKDIYDTVETGTPLSDAFERHPKIFDNIFVNILRAGESSGKLTTFLYKLVEQIEKSEKIRRKVKGAMMYPIIVLCVAISVILVMMIKVVPVFQEMFSSMGGQLPAPTQLIINISEFLRDPMRGGVLFFLVGATFVGLKMLIMRNIGIQYKFHKFLLKIPLIGDVITKSTLAKMAMIEGNLSAAGVPVLEALGIVKNSINNLIFKDVLKAVQTGISSGKTLSGLFAESEYIPPTFAQMLAVGEETGKMDDMFEATAHYYEEEFDIVVDRLTEMLEPIMIVFMGITIGFIIVAMYMPIFEMGSMVK